MWNWFVSRRTVFLLCTTAFEYFGDILSIVWRGFPSSNSTYNFGDVDVASVQYNIVHLSLPPTYILGMILKFFLHAKLVCSYNKVLFCTLGYNYVIIQQVCQTSLKKFKNIILLFQISVGGFVESFGLRGFTQIASCTCGSLRPQELDNSIPFDW